MILVTQPFLPPKKDYDALIDQVWQRNWLTNNGPLLRELEQNLKDYLNIEHLLFTGNGTIAIQMAIKALGLQGEIITTPFSYVATTSSIVWENCVPVFADIEKAQLTIDPDQIEKLITEKTTAILATHVFGLPCQVEAIQSIASRYNLKVIYDGAHAFGTTYKNKSLLAYGDICTLSTHATKLFHTIEGGAVITQTPELLNKLAYLRNFGHDGYDQYNGVGINGKNSEFHAAMGIANMPYITNIIEKRKLCCERYDSFLLKYNVTRPEIPEDTIYNFSYYPLIFESSQVATNVIEGLAKEQIFARRYFYPSLSSLNYVSKQITPVCDDIASKILCLPLYYDLSLSEIDLICSHIGAILIDK